MLVLKDNKHMGTSEHNIEKDNNDETDKKRAHDKLHSLTDKYEEIAK